MKMKNIMCFFSHRFLPVLVRYCSFNFRWIVWECERCGKVTVEKVEQKYIYPASTIPYWEDSKYDKFIEEHKAEIKKYKKYV